MPIIHLETVIHADCGTCFNAARSIDLHMKSTSHTKEKAVAGVTSGLIGPGETATWEAVHLGVKQKLSVKITDYEYPRMFVDEMTKGAFKTMKHRHEFVSIESGTRMIDTLEFTSPLGWLGNLANVMFLERYMQDFLIKRNDFLKKQVEQDVIW